MSKISKGNIILIGFMASGKSVVARKLATKLKMPLTDTDTLIENEKGMKIRNIFKVHGEPYFRKLEKEIVKKISGLKGVIISTGGGIVLNAENCRILRKCGTVFYLKANANAILNRIKKIGANERPLLMGKPNLKDKIKRLLKLRTPYYQGCAHYVIDTSKITVQEVVQKIVSLITRITKKEKC